jgi:hypothetical protein
MLLCCGRDANDRGRRLCIRRHDSVEVVQGGEDAQADIPRNVAIRYARSARVAIWRLAGRALASRLRGTERAWILGSRCEFRRHAEPMGVPPRRGCPSVDIAGCRPADRARASSDLATATRVALDQKSNLHQLGLDIDRPIGRTPRLPHAGSETRSPSSRLPHSRARPLPAAGRSFVGGHVSFCDPPMGLQRRRRISGFSLAA